MDRIILAILFAVGLFLGMFLLLEVGRRIGRKHRKEQQDARAGLGAVEGAVFALLGLLVAFTFSGAAARFDARRQLIVDEANAISTAWMRLDFLPPEAQPALRDLFRDYVDLRLAVYRKLPDMEAARAELAKANAVQLEIWRVSQKALESSSSATTAQLIPALNQTFDIATTRTMASQTHPPTLIFIMLGVLALASSLLAGYAMAGGKNRNWIHTTVFVFIVSVTVYVILDLEFPRLGMLRVDSFDEVLRDVRENMQ